MKGIIITTAAGGACNDSRARRFTKDANSATGKCLSKQLAYGSVLREKSLRRAQEEFCHPEKPGTVFQVKNVSVEERIEAGVE